MTDGQPSRDWLALDVRELRFGKKLAEAAAQLILIFDGAQSGKAGKHGVHAFGRVDGDFADEDFRVARSGQALFVNL